MSPDSGKPCLNVHIQYTMHAAFLLDDWPTAAQRLLCALGTQPVGKKEGFLENFNIKIFAPPSTGGLSLWYNSREGFAWPRVLGVGVSRRQVGRSVKGPCF